MLTGNSFCMTCQLLNGSEADQVGAARGMLRCLRMLANLHAKRYALSMGMCHDLAVMAKLDS